MNGIDTMESVIEAILFALGDAVTVKRLMEVLDADRDSVLRALQMLSDRYDFERRGVMLARMEDKVQLCSRPDYADYVRRAAESRRQPSLSSAALEVLSIVAYRQPVTRAFIEQLRGVDSANTVALLVEKGLIEECGRLDVPGRPMLFCTTTAFLRTFSISSLEELPSLPELTGAPGEQLTLEVHQPGDGAPPETEAGDES